MEAQSPCLCFPCILYYLGGYIFPKSHDQYYPMLAAKGFTDEEQKAIAEEWYWIAVERETAVRDYLRGELTFRDGCWWRPPPGQGLPSSTPSTPASGASGGSNT